jgi:hypothetical protein
VKKLSLLVLLAAMTLLSGCKKNQVPDRAAVPSGPAVGSRGAVLTFTSSATDPEDDSVAIRFDWGDGDTSAWSAWLAGSTSSLDSHSWAVADTFLVRAQAKDGAGLSSGWSEPFAVAIVGGWTRTFGGNNNDRGHLARQTSDGGYIIVGWTDSYGSGSADVYLIKTDAGGSQTWTKTFGGSESDEGHSVQQTSDGGYIILGGSGSFRADFWLIKTDADGNQVWTKGFGETGRAEGHSVQQTSDGGYILVGGTYPPSSDSGDIRLVKTDASGNQTWARAFGGTGHEDGYSVQQTSDGGYILVGETDTGGGDDSDVYLIKTDANGNQTWAKTFGEWGWDEGHSVQQTSDGGFIIAGYSEYNAGTDAHDVYLIKTDADGNQTWARRFGGPGTERGRAVQQTSDGGYIVAGETYPSGGGSADAYLIKTDASGTETWTRTYGGAADDGGYSVRQTADGGFVICGTTASYGADKDDVWLVKTDANGNVE